MTIRQDYSIRARKFGDEEIGFLTDAFNSMLVRVGLAWARRVIMGHGGKMWAEAAPDAGATFYFSLAAGVSAGGCAVRFSSENHCNR